MVNDPDGFTGVTVTVLLPNGTSTIALARETSDLLRFINTDGTTDSTISESTTNRFYEVVIDDTAINTATGGNPSTVANAGLAGDYVFTITNTTVTNTLTDGSITSPVTNTNTITKTVTFPTSEFNTTLPQIAFPTFNQTSGTTGLIVTGVGLDTSQLTTAGERSGETIGYQIAATATVRGQVIEFIFDGTGTDTVLATKAQLEAGIAVPDGILTLASSISFRVLVIDSLNELTFFRFTEGVATPYTP